MNFKPIRSRRINEQKIVQRWAERISKSTGIKDPEKLRWMSIMCEDHLLSESQSYGGSLFENANATLGNTPGMGAVTLPGQPTTQTGFQGQTAGSGDKPMSLLPLAMQVAGQTVGLDMLPVVNMGGPLGFLNYVDFIYAGGRGLGNELNVTAIPYLIEIPITSRTLETDPVNGSSAVTPIALNPATPPRLLLRNANLTTHYLRTRYIAHSRINGFAILAIEGIYLTSGNTLVAGPADESAALNVFDILDGASEITYQSVDLTDDTTVLSSGTVSGGVLANYVKALENVVKGFTADSDASWTKVVPYEREKGETTHSRSMGLKFFNKAVSAKTIQVDIGVTREQIQDSRQFGFDIMSQINAILANELSQAINANILDRIFSLGLTNHINIAQKENVDFHTNLGTSALAFTAIDAALAGYGYTGQTGEVITFDQKTTASDIPAVAVTGGETQYSINRRLYGSVLAGKNIINIRGRRGPADSLVTNGQVITILQDVAGFQAAPMANTVNQQSVYNTGTLAGIQLFTDPQMDWGQNVYSLFRKGDGATSGLVFMPYLMAESVDTIAEDTMSPKIQVKSRYDIVEAGFYPEAYYLTSYVGGGANLIR